MVSVFLLLFSSFFPYFMVPEDRKRAADTETGEYLISDEKICSAYGMIFTTARRVRRRIRLNALTQE